MNQNLDDQGRLLDHYEPPLQEPEKYTPRPKWQIILAWVLFAIVIISIINICYWEIFG